MPKHDIYTKYEYETYLITVNHTYVESGKVTFDRCLDSALVISEAFCLPSDYRKDVPPSLSKLRYSYYQEIMKLLMKYLSGLVRVYWNTITHQHYVYVCGAAQEPKLGRLVWRNRKFFWIFDPAPLTAFWPDIYIVLKSRNLLLGQPSPPLVWTTLNTAYKATC